MNAWANSLMAQAGQPLPVRNFVHERWVTMPLGRPPRLPATNDDAKGVYYRPTEDDRVLLGTGAHEAVQIERPGPDFRLTQLVPDPRSLPFIQEAVRHRLPLIRGVEIDYHRVGLVSYALDFLPNIGPGSRPPGTLSGGHLQLGRLRLLSRRWFSLGRVHGRWSDQHRRFRILPGSFSGLRHPRLPGRGRHSRGDDPGP